MTFAPLSLGTTATPIIVPSPLQLAALLACGPLDLGKLNGVLKVLGDRIDAVDANDNAITGATYNPATNLMTFTLAEGPSVGVDMTGVLADFVGSISGVPAGIISMWSGAIVAIPIGWALCDGTSGTPDLRNRFIIGAGGTEAVGATGGTSTHSHSAEVGDHALTEAEIPAHAHLSVWDGLSNAAITSGSAISGQRTLGGDTEYILNGSAGANANVGVTSLTGGGAAHSHTITIDSANSVPPFYALAYVMKL